MEPINDPTPPPPPTTLGAAVAALWTFAFTSFGTAVMLLTGWLSDVAGWIASDDEAAVFPDMDRLVKVAVALGLAAVCAGINFLYRWAQTKDLFQFLPGPAPMYPTVEPVSQAVAAESRAAERRRDAGDVSRDLLLGILVGVVVIVVLIVVF